MPHPLNLVGYLASKTTCQKMSCEEDPKVKAQRVMSKAGAQPLTDDKKPAAAADMSSNKKQKSTAEIMAHVEKHAAPPKASTNKPKVVRKDGVMTTATPMEQAPLVEPGAELL